MKSRFALLARTHGCIVMLLAALACPALALQEIGASAPDESASRIIISPRDHFSVRIWTNRSSYHVGDPVRIYFRASRSAHVYIFDTEPDGVTHQLFPNFYDTENYVTGGVTYSIPDPGYELRVTGPSGWETLRIVAVRERVYVLNEYDRGFTRSMPFPERAGGAPTLVEKLRRSFAEPKSDAKPVYPDRYLELRPYPRPYPEPSYAESSVSIQVVGDYWTPPSIPRRYGELRITSTPSGARIYVDSSSEGTTPKTLHLSPGSHEIMLVKSGYEVWRTTVYAHAGGYERLKVLLVRRSGVPWPRRPFEED